MTDAKLKEIEARVALVRTESASSATGAAWTSTYQASAADVPALLAALRTERARADLAERKVRSQAACMVDAYSQRDAEREAREKAEAEVEIERQATAETLAGAEQDRRELRERAEKAEATIGRLWFKLHRRHYGDPVDECPFCAESVAALEAGEP